MYNSMLHMREEEKMEKNHKIELDRLAEDAGVKIVDEVLWYKNCQNKKELIQLILFYTFVFIAMLIGIVVYGLNAME